MNNTSASFGMHNDPYTKLSARYTSTVLPFLFSLSIITNCLNLAILCRRILLQHSCTHYFIAQSWFNIIYIVIVLIVDWIDTVFSMRLTTRSLAGCRIYAYFSSVSAFGSIYMLVLACFDRWCSSTIHQFARDWIRVKIARRAITLVTVAVTVYRVEALVLYNLIQNECVWTASVAEQFISIVMFYIVPHVFMLSFGLLTVKNVRAIRIQPAIALAVSTLSSGRQQLENHRQRRENQLVRMLLTQVLINVLFFGPYSIYRFLIFYKAIRLTGMTSFGYRLSVSWMSLAYGTSFFAYLLSGTTYRAELFRLLRKFRECLKKIIS